MNAPPPDDIKAAGEAMLRPGQDLSIPDEKAELGRRAVARHYPDDVETGKATWKQLGIEKGKP
jgi:hypothetical protein